MDATVVQVMIEHDRTGVICEIGKIMADNALTFKPDGDPQLGSIMIEMHVDKTDGDGEAGIRRC